MIMMDYGEKWVVRVKTDLSRRERKIMMEVSFPHDEWWNELVLLFSHHQSLPYSLLRYTQYGENMEFY